MSTTTERKVTVASGLGDADASQVMAGSTFSSESGFNQEGKFIPSADNITYDNATSKLGSTNTQGAIDEIVTLTNESGHSIDVTLNKSTYVMAISLKDKNGEVLNEKTVDFPMETAFVNASYDKASKTMKFTLESGSTVDVPLGDLVEGLVSQTDFDVLSGEVEEIKTDTDMLKKRTDINYFLPSRTYYIENGISILFNKDYWFYKVSAGTSTAEGEYYLGYLEPAYTRGKWFVGMPPELAEFGDYINIRIKSGSEIIATDIGNGCAIPDNASGNLEVYLYIAEGITIAEQFFIKTMCCDDHSLTYNDYIQPTGGKGSLINDLAYLSNNYALYKRDTINPLKTEVQTLKTEVESNTNAISEIKANITTNIYNLNDVVLGKWVTTKNGDSASSTSWAYLPLNVKGLKTVTISALGGTASWNKHYFNDSNGTTIAYNNSQVTASVPSDATILYVNIYEEFTDLNTIRITTESVGEVVSDINNQIDAIKNDVDTKYVDTFYLGSSSSTTFDISGRVKIGYPIMIMVYPVDDKPGIWNYVGVIMPSSLNIYIVTLNSSNIEITMDSNYIITVKNTNADWGTHFKMRLI